MISTILLCLIGLAAIIFLVFASRNKPPEVPRIISRKEKQAYEKVSHLALIVLIVLVVLLVCVLFLLYYL